MNNLATDICSIMQRQHQIISANFCFSHVFMVLCDSHGLHLLIEAIISKYKKISDTIKKTQGVVATFAHSKLQLAIL